MAMQKLLLSDDYPSDADIKRLLVEETKQVIADKPNIGPMNYQHGCIHRHNPPRPVLGQLGLCQRVTAYKRTICSAANHPVSNHQGVTEIVRDRVITISTRELVSIPKHPAVSQNQSVFKNMNPAIVNQTTKRTTFLYPYHAAPTPNPKPFNFSNYKEFQSKNNVGGASPSPFHAPFCGRKHQTVLPDDLLTHKSSGVRVRVSDRLPESKSPTPVNSGVPNHHRMVDRGPYTCIQCGELFVTAQCYATHVMAHYQSENFAERLKKQTSNYWENLQLAQAGYGVPLEGPRSKKPKIDVKIEAAVKKEETDVQTVVKQELPFEGVVIKKESN